MWNLLKRLLSSILLQAFKTKALAPYRANLVLEAYSALIPSGPSLQYLGDLIGVVEPSSLIVYIRENSLGLHVRRITPKDVGGVKLVVEKHRESETISRHASTRVGKRSSYGKGVSHSRSHTVIDYVTLELILHDVEQPLLTLYFETPEQGAEWKARFQAFKHLAKTTSQALAPPLQTLSIEDAPRVDTPSMPLPPPKSQ